MTYTFFPQGFLGRPLSLTEVGEPRLRGNDVIALQTACGLEDRDGVFGPVTDGAVRLLQRALGVKDDGISGPGTESAFCLREITINQAGVPVGLPVGIVLGESGMRFGAQSPTYRHPPSFELRADLGAVQFSTPEADEAAVRRALDPAHGIKRLCDHLRAKREEYRWAPYVKAHNTPVRLAGWLACGSWNAPSWTDVWARNGPDDPILQREVRLTSGVLGTREQWVRNYVASKLAFVTDWRV